MVTEAASCGRSFHIFSSQGMSDLRASRGNYYTMLILRVVVTSSQPSVAT